MSQNIVAFVMSSGKEINFAAIRSFPEKYGTAYTGKAGEVRSGDEVRQLFAGWDADTTALVSVCTRLLILATHR